MVPTSVSESRRVTMYLTVQPFRGLQKSGTASANSRWLITAVARQQYLGYSNPYLVYKRCLHQMKSLPWLLTILVRPGDSGDNQVEAGRACRRQHEDAVITIWAVHRNCSGIVSLTHCTQFLYFEPQRAVTSSSQMPIVYAPR